MANIPRFDANDFYLVETDPLALREQLREALAAVLGREVLDSDPHMVLASAFLPFMVQGQASADAAAKATLRAFAVGADLDRIADSTCVVGYLDRRPALGAVMACILTVTVTRTEILDAEQIAVSCHAERPVEIDGESATFAGDADFLLEFAAGTQTKTLNLPIYLVSDVTGEKGNGLLWPSGNVHTPIADDEITAAVTATDSISRACTCEDISVARCGSTYNGADAESDDDFALRVAWQAKALRVPGSFEYFKLALSGLHEIASTYVAPRVDSQGRIVMAYADKTPWYAHYGNITLDARGSAYDAFVGTVRDSLLAEQRVMSYAAKEYAETYSVYYKLPSVTTDLASARAKVESAWRLYVAAHSWHCGVVLSQPEMCAVLTDAGATNVRIDTLAPNYKPLPADTMITDRFFGLHYDGLSIDTATATGGDGEEIVP